MLNVPRSPLRARRSSLPTPFRPRLERLEERALLSGNLIVNGDFETGDTGFTTDYRPYPGGLLLEGYYAITTNPHLVHSDAASYGDHTTGSGNMMVANGALVPNTLLWSQTVVVDPATHYHFSFWSSSWYPASPARLEVLVNGVSLGTATAPLQAGVWGQFTAAWDSGTATTATIQIFDRNTDFSGNDFAIDDLSLTSGNLIVNGDFEMGDTGFTTDYVNTGSLLDVGTYAVTTDPSLVQPYATSYGDHTSGMGNMLAANGAVQPNTLLWSQTVAVDPSTHYDFSLWSSSWYSLSPARLEVLVNGVSLGTATAPLQAGVWGQFTAAWDSGTATTATIQIFDRNTDFSGNDFAIDDLSLVAQPQAQVSIVPTALVRSSNDGFDITYEIRGGNLPTATTVALYWATGPTLGDRIGNSAISLAAHTAEGSYTFHIPSALLGDAPPDATHLLLVTDPDGLIHDVSDANVLALGL
jgi:hypothetical protein